MIDISWNPMHVPAFELDWIGWMNSTVRRYLPLHGYYVIRRREKMYSSTAHIPQIGKKSPRLLASMALR
jgi:hypothetical protein